MKLGSRHAPTIATAAGAAGTVIALLIDPRTALAAYLASVVAVTAIPIGAVAILMTSYLVRGRRTETLHAPLAAAVCTMPVAALLFVPVLSGLSWLYPWAQDSASLGAFKSIYLAPWFFVARTVIYFAVWTVLAFWAMRAWNDPPRMTMTGSAGLIVYALTVSFAGVDWFESLTPDFHSSTYGLLFVSFEMLTGLAFGLAAVLIWGPRPRPLGGYGALLLSMLLLWAYLHAMQYIVIWAGDIPEEVAWYIERSRDGWAVVLCALFILQFIIPFFAMLTARVRGRARPLLAIAVTTLALRPVEAYWLVLPGLGLSAIALLLAVPATLMLVGALWWLAFRYVSVRGKRDSLVPRGPG